MSILTLIRHGFVSAFACSVLVFAPAAPATVTVTACGGEGSDFDADCSLAELLARPLGVVPTITVDETVFGNFVWLDGFVIGSALGPMSQVRVLGIDSRQRPGLRFTDMGTAWHRVGGLNLALSTLRFDILRTQGEDFPVFGRNLFASFGQIAYFDMLDPELSDSIFIKDRMRLLDPLTNEVIPGGHNEATLQCFASEEGLDVGAGDQPSCAFTSRRDGQGGTPRLLEPPQPQNAWLQHYYYRADMEFNFASEASGETELNELFYQLRLTPLVTRPIALPDINGNGRVDVGALLESSVTVEIREGADPDLLLKRMSYFDANHDPVAAAWIPDADGDGSGELAVLATRLSDGRPVVEIRNLNPGVAENPRQIEFHAGHTAVGIQRIPVDVDGNGVPEIAVLSFNANERGLVEVVNANGERNRVGIWLQANLHPRQFVALEDSDNNGVPEVAVLAQRTSDFRMFVEVANADDSQPHNVISFRKTEFPVNIAALGDNDGDSVRELAVLTRDFGAGTGYVDIRNVYGAQPQPPTRRFRAAPDGYVPRLVRAVNNADNNDPTQEVAVLSVGSSDLRPVVRVAEASGDGEPNDIEFGAVLWEDRGLMVLDDANGNGVPEVAVLFLRVKDGRIVINIRDAAGPSKALDGTSYFFEP